MEYIISNKIIILCASHIGSIKRLNQFERLINSILTQTLLVKIHISMSYDIVYRGQLDTVMNKYDNEIINIHLQENRKSQFEHYRWLCKNIDIRDKWIMFTDDDDEFGKCRVKIFYNKISQIPESKLDIVRSVNHIRIMNGRREPGEGREYVSYACHSYLFDSFFEISEDISRSVYCDMLFGIYLRLNANTIYNVDAVDNSEYIQDGVGNHRTNTNLTKEDDIICRLLLIMAQNSFHRKEKDKIFQGMNRDECREHLSNVLIRLKNLSSIELLNLFNELHERNENEDNSMECFINGEPSDEYTKIIKLFQSGEYDKFIYPPIIKN